MKVSRKKILENTSSYRDGLIESLKNDPEELALYIQVTIEDYEENGNIKPFLVALRNIVDVKGGISQLAEQTKLNRQSLYKTLSLDGNPRFDTLITILKAIGVKMSFKPEISINSKQENAA